MDQRLVYLLQSWKERVQYMFPTETTEKTEFPDHIQTKIPEDKLLRITVHVDTDEVSSRLVTQHKLV